MVLCFSDTANDVTVSDRYITSRMIALILQVCLITAISVRTGTAGVSMAGEVNRRSQGIWHQLQLR
jgi:hypothetical protein